MARLPTPSTAVRWILLVVIVAVLVSVGMVHHNRLQAEQEALLDRIAQSNASVAQLRAKDLSPLQQEIADLESRGRTAEARESALSRDYRTYTHSIEIQERLVRAASETNCTITEMRCNGPNPADALSPAQTG